jgi:hypothetical protein
VESELTAANVRIKELEKNNKDAASSQSQDLDDLKQQHDQLKESHDTSMTYVGFF